MFSLVFISSEKYELFKNRNGNPGYNPQLTLATLDMINKLATLDLIKQSATLDLINKLATLDLIKQIDNL